MQKGGKVMALEFIEKDNQFRIKLQVNFIEKVNDPARGKEQGVEVYIAQSSDGRKKGSQEPLKVVEFYTDWIPDTPINRQVMIVGLRVLVSEQGEELFSLKELAQIVGSRNRQAASQHVEDFRDGGEQFEGFVLRKRKVDHSVVEAVEAELEKEVWI
jgi:hypothetical protein